MTTNTRTHRIRRLVVSTSLAALLGVAAVGCSSDDSDSAKSVSSDATTTTVAANGGQNASSGQSSGGQSSGGQSSGGGQSSAAAPVINSFSTPENIDCHNGNLQNFTASWTTSNAVKVTISIDGGGVYNTYGANGETSLPFNCSSPHTFLLTAFNSDGATATKSITLQPRNVQTQTSDDEDTTTTTHP